MLKATRTLKGLSWMIEGDTFVCRYAHQNDEVPEGWTVTPLQGWHGDNGRVMWSMPMTNGRQKGAAFERECAKKIFLATGLDAKRDLEQYRAGDHGDLIGVPGWTIECKRYARGTTWRTEWWAQVESAANAAGCEPALIYKFDRHPIRVVVRLSSVSQEYMTKDDTVEMSFDTWAMLVSESLCNV